MKAPLIAVLALTGISLTPGLIAQAADPTASPSPAQTAPTPNKIIYGTRLPTPQEIAAAAAPQGLIIQSMEQTGADITVVYDLGKGQTNTVSYQLLPGANSSPTPATVVAAPPAPSTPAPAAPAPAAPAAPTVVYTQAPAPTTPAPTVIYTQAPTTQVIYAPVASPVYYSNPYYPYGYGYGYGFPRVTIGVGFGGGYHGGGYHGGGWHH